MAARYAAMEMDSNAGDSVASTPRSEHHQNLADDGVSSMQQLPRVRFMCSFGGKILPRPHDNQLRYVGGDTRIVALNRHASFSSLLVKLSKLAGTASVVVKYQLPNEDLDSLITVTTDEDVENMMDEYDRVVAAQSHKSAARLRLFLFPTDADSRASAINSILDGSAKREHWFFDALNGGSGPGLERGRSEASSIVSEMPDYLFGLENADEPPLRESRMKNNNKHLFHENASNSDPGSPAPAVSSPFCSTSSALATPHVMPDLPPVKTKPDQQILAAEPKATPIESGENSKPGPHQQSGYSGSPYWHYPGPQVQPMPIYYVPGVGPVQAAGSHPPHTIPQRGQYVQPFQVIPGQVPVGFPQQVSSIGQVYGGMRPVMGLDSHEINQAVLYGARNGGTIPGYSSAGGEEIQGLEGKVGRVPHPG